MHKHKLGLEIVKPLYSLQLVALCRAETNLNEAHEMSSSTEIFSKRRKIYSLWRKTRVLTHNPRLHHIKEADLQALWFHYLESRSNEYHYLSTTYFVMYITNSISFLLKHTIQNKVCIQERNNLLM